MDEVTRENARRQAAGDVRRLLDRPGLRRAIALARQFAGWLERDADDPAARPPPSTPSDSDRSQDA